MLHRFTPCRTQTVWLISWARFQRPYTHKSDVCRLPLCMLVILMFQKNVRFISKVSPFAISALCPWRSRKVEWKIKRMWKYWCLFLFLFFCSSDWPQRWTVGWAQCQPLWMAHSVSQGDLNKQNQASHSFTFNIRSQIVYEGFCDYWYSAIHKFFDLLKMKHRVLGRGSTLCNHMTLKPIIPMWCGHDASCLT